MKQCNLQIMRKHNTKSDASSQGSILNYVCSDNSGVAMLTVLIVGVVVTVFCLSLLLVSYTLFSQTSRKTTQLECKILAQSTAETLGKELQNSDSELAAYLSNQIKDGYWISEDEYNSSDDIPQQGVVSELVLKLDAGQALKNYNVYVTLTYNLNVVDDEGEGDGDEDDDQDEDLSGGKPSGNNPENSGYLNNSNASSNDNPPGNGTYSIKASIKCIRGSEEDRDAQSYTIETVYPAVGL